MSLEQPISPKSDEDGNQDPEIPDTVRQGSGSRRYSERLHSLREMIPAATELPRSRTLIPLPLCCQNERCERIWRTVKYIYVALAFLFGLVIIALENFSDPVKDYLDEKQEIIIDNVLEDGATGYVICVLWIVVMVLLKSVGLPDVLSLRTMAVALFCWKMIPNNLGLSTVLCMLILGMLSAISHLIEYRLIGAELQYVQGKPAEVAFWCLRRLLLLCKVEEERIKWVDPKWTLELSEKTRRDEKLHLVTNLDRIVTPWFKRKFARWPCSKDISTQSQQRITAKNSKDVSITADRSVPDQHSTASSAPSAPSAVSTHSELSDRSNPSAPRSTHPSHSAGAGKGSKRRREDDVECDWHCTPRRMRTATRMAWKCFIYLLAAFWASCTEWIQPLSEFVIFAHNWDFTVSNAVVVVLMEFVDIDRIVETVLIMEHMQRYKNPIGGKSVAVVWKWVFYVVGWGLIFPWTLFWYYQYLKHPKLSRDGAESVSTSERREICVNGLHPVHTESSKNVMTSEDSKPRVFTVTSADEQNMRRLAQEEEDASEAMTEPSPLRIPTTDIAQMDAEM